MASLSEGLHTCCASARGVGSLCFKGLLCSALFPRLVNLMFSARFLAGGVFAECCRFSFLACRIAIAGAFASTSLLALQIGPHGCVPVSRLLACRDPMPVRARAGVRSGVPYRWPRLGLGLQISSYAMSSRASETAASSPLPSASWGCVQTLTESFFAGPVVRAGRGLLVCSEDTVFLDTAFAGFLTDRLSRSPGMRRRRVVGSHILRPSL